MLSVTAKYFPVVSGDVRQDLVDEVNLPYLVQSKPGRSAPLEAERGVYDDLADRCQRFVDLLEAGMGTEDIEIEGRTVELRKFINKLWVFTETGITSVQMDVRVELGRPVQRLTVMSSDLTEAQRRLLDSISTTVDAFCWKHLRRRFEIPSPAVTRPTVFISYRKGHEEFARALAERLGREGFVPWFDEWELHAGDSLPGKIEEGLASSVAFIAVLTSDYTKGRWATEELEPAIHRRVEEGFPIIPVLLHSSRKAGPSQTLGSRRLQRQ